jgi:hypothetical protein
MYQTTKQTNKQMSMTLELVTQRVEVLEKQMAMLLANNNDTTEQVNPKKEKKQKKDKKEDSDDEKPKKKRISGYILYSNATRDEVKEALSADGEKPKNPDIMKELAKNWKALTEEEQEVWNTKAKEIKEAQD